MMIYDEEWKTDFLDTFDSDPYFKQRVVEKLFYNLKDDSNYSHVYSSFICDLTDCIVDEIIMRLKDDIVNEVIRKMVSYRDGSVSKEVSDKIFDILVNDGTIKDSIIEEVSSFLLRMHDVVEIKEEVEKTMLKARSYRFDLLDLEDESIH